MIQQLLSISRNAFTESIRQPIFVVLVLVTLLALVLNPSLANYTLDDDNAMLVEMGLSTLFLCGLLMAGFTAAGVLGKEIENKTVLIVASKPVARPLFVLGKYLGVAGALALAYWALSAVFLLTVRHGVMQTVRDTVDGPVVLFGILAALAAVGGSAAGNYLYRWVFTSSFVLILAAVMTLAWGLTLLISPQWRFQWPGTDLDPQIILGLWLIFQLVLILAAVAIVASIYLRQVMTLAVCVMVFMVGMISEPLHQSLAGHYRVLAAFCRLLPNLQIFWPADAITRSQALTPTYTLLATGYAVLYLTALLALAVAIFQKREVG